ncbi:MAG: HPr family phosphocarrier protein [Oscillospiraceae bacterium]|nr:HPr family phosphocarrier protein [Oscillospiraceae bacterium]
MKELKIMLGTIEDVKEFVNITNKYEFDCDLISGRYAVDAKSIMGIFSLDLAKPLDMVIRGEGKSTEELYEEIAKFAAK